MIIGGNNKRRWSSEMRAARIDCGKKGNFDEKLGFQSVEDVRRKEKEVFKKGKTPQNTLLKL